MAPAGARGGRPLGGDGGRVMVFARFLPRNEAFFDEFAAAAANAVEAANLLGEVIDHTSDSARQVHRLRDLEHRGDEITHRIFNALNSTFVTPLDREDIQRLAVEIDDFVDDLEETAQRIHLYRVTEAPEQAHLFVRILQEQAQCLADAIPLLEDVGKNVAGLRKAVVEVHRLENEADDALEHVLAALYDDIPDIPTLIVRLQWRELFALLENATDRAEDVANVLETIVLKNG
jgi:uncharacterized protein